jgi:cytidylate kinase
MKDFIITIDGASSSGKSTLAKGLAKHFGFKHIDSGAMYRALTYYALELQLLGEDFYKIKELKSLLPTIKIDFNSDDFVMLNGKVIEGKIRSLEVAKYVSIIAKESIFRKFLVDRQRELGERGNVVMDGRDIGSVVFPKAEIKFFLEASIDVRTARRFTELKEKGDVVSYKEVYDNIAKRDEIDSTRLDSPLVKPTNAIVLSSQESTSENLLAKAIDEIEKKRS